MPYTIAQPSRDFKGIWIPAEIWLREDLSIQGKALWAEVHSLHDRRRGGCFASDEYLMNFLQVKKSRFYDVRKELMDAGLLERVSFNGRQRIIKAIMPPQQDDLQAGEQLSGKPETRGPENRNAHVRDPGMKSEIPFETSYIENKEERKELQQPTPSAPPIKQSVVVPSVCLELGATEEDMRKLKKLYPEEDIIAAAQLAKDQGTEVRIFFGWIRDCIQSGYKATLNQEQRAKENEKWWNETCKRYEGKTMANTRVDKGNTYVEFIRNGQGNCCTHYEFDEPNFQTKVKEILGNLIQIHNGGAK